MEIGKKFKYLIFSKTNSKKNTKEKINKLKIYTLPLYSTLALSFLMFQTLNITIIDYYSRNETDIRRFPCSKTEYFKKGGMKSFILTCQRYEIFFFWLLGLLNICPCVKGLK